MPCRSDYLEPTAREIALANIFLLLDELDGKKLDLSKYNLGTDPRSYNNSSQELLDSKTDELCSRLQLTDVTKYSLEMQMWWRDHRQADKKRLEKEIKKYHEDSVRESALSKLTSYERKLLGL